MTYVNKLVLVINAKDENAKNKAVLSIVTVIVSDTKITSNWFIMSVTDWLITRDDLITCAFELPPSKRLFQNIYRKVSRIEKNPARRLLFARIFEHTGRARPAMGIPTIQANIFKCSACRKNFSAVWIPNKICCRIAMAEQKPHRSLGNTYSRHMTLQLSQEAHGMSNEAGKKVNLAKEQTGRTSKAGDESNVDMGKIYRNCIAPFSSLGKPTCGHFFSRGTDHRKRKIGIPPSNLVQWRSYISWGKGIRFRQPPLALCYRWLLNSEELVLIQKQCVFKKTIDRDRIFWLFKLGDFEHQWNWTIGRAKRRISKVKQEKI